MQQKGNELSLKTEKQARVLNAHLGKSIVQMLLEGSWPIRSSGERRNATILFSDIRDFTPFSEKSTPESVFQTLNQYIPATLDPIQEHSGIVDKIAGDAVMAVFGILNPVDAAPKLAVSTATAILRNVADLNDPDRGRAAVFGSWNWHRDRSGCGRAHRYLRAARLLCHWTSRELCFTSARSSATGNSR